MESENLWWSVPLAVVQVLVVCGCVFLAFRAGRRSMLDELWDNSEWVSDTPAPRPIPPGGARPEDRGGAP